MSVLFFDSSALVKRYAREVGTNWVLGLVRPAGNRLYLARITGVEVVAALTKRQRTGSVTAAAAAKAINRFEREFSNRVVLIDITPRVIENAMALAQRHPLRGYDAVQLAAALVTDQIRKSAGGTALTFISADINLNNAAAAEGLNVDNPNHHP